MRDSDLAALLRDLGRKVRARICRQRLSVAQASAVAEVRLEDTIFALDRHVEPLLLEEISRWPAGALPVGLFAEGLGEAPTIVGGRPDEAVRFWLLIDPVDGTRGLMTDKRPAWFLAAAAPGEVASPRLSDVTASVAVELPTSKQDRADTFAWSKGAAVEILRETLDGASQAPVADAGPSRATTLDYGFGSVVAYFAHGKREAADLAWEIARAGGDGERPAQVYDDQFISSGGQLLELLTGRDRYVIDLRPCWNLPGSQCAHPYDLAIAPLAMAAGVVVTDAAGAPLDAAFSLTGDIAWCGYANPAIQAIVEPVVRACLDRRGLQ